MVPKFTSQEKEQIRKSLLTKGRELFIQYGLAKTSIDDIVLACGIAKGSFYTFFSSKEELYFEILKNEEEVRETVLNQLFRDQLEPKELLVSFFQTSFEFVEDNPFLERVFQGGELERLSRKLPEQMSHFTKEQSERGRQAINILIDQGVLPKDDPRIIVGILQAILTLRLHKEEIGENIFSEVMKRMIEYIAEGLTEKRD